MSQEVGLLGIELTPVARADKLDGVNDGSKLVEAFLEGVLNEGLGCRMMAASPRV